MVKRRFFGVVGSLLFSVAAGGCFALGWDYHEGPNSCSTDADCTDDNPCHVASCSADGSCTVANATQDPPDPHPGDCQRVHCVDGMPTTVSDPSDVDDDGDPCTKDACEAGKPVHTPVADGGSCMNEGHAGVCDKGACVIPCKGSTDCTSASPCVLSACDLGTNRCTFTLLDGVPAPGPAIVGDCLDVTCIKGVAKEVADPDDLPKVSDCYKALCVDSADPSHPLKPSKTPKAQGAACSTGGSFCDGSGECVDCVDDAQCPSDGNLCHTAKCNGSGACTYPNTAAGPSPTLLSMQVPGDCHRYQCDGNGNVINAVDQSDPTNGGNPCVNYSCDIAGNNQTTNKMNGTSCGGGVSCLNGMCSGCTMTSQCPSHPLEACDGAACACPGSGLQLETCSSQGLTCGTISDTGCGASLNCNNGSKDGTETDVDCGGPPASCAARCAQGKACNVNSDCANGACADGFCCENPCTGACLACSVALNGVANGLCRPVQGSTDSGLCDATHGACTGGPPCICLGGSCIKGCTTDSDCGICATCNSGTCVTVAKETQTPGRCDDTNGNCATTCTSQGVNDCGTKCACGSAGACLLKDGEACTCDANCAYGNCNNSHSSCTNAATGNLCGP